MQAPPAIVIVGGGFCGAATAWHLAQALPRGQASVTVVEPRARLGGGLSYSTADPAHRINVPATKMTLRTDDIPHFARWLARDDTPGPDAAALAPSGDLFPQRALFGAYVAAHLAPDLASGAVVHRQASAVSAVPQAGGWRVGLSDGSALFADALVLATTHPPPGLPGALAPFADDPRVVGNPYAPDALEAIAPEERVLIVGTGLTSADMIASLDRRGHRGGIVALSRHGYRSQPHGPKQDVTAADFAQGAGASARQVLRRVRAAVAADAARGLTWHAALDLVRTQGRAIWAALDLAERARLLRHLRTLWDVHRFRIAPQVVEVIERRLATGSLVYRAGRLLAVAASGDGLAVTWRARGADTSATDTFDRIIVTTGPAHGSVTRSNPLLASLAAQGLVQPDPLGLGLFTEPDGRARPVTGRLPAPLFICGPLARASVGELMGVPEVTAHAEHTARQVVLWLGTIPATARAAG